MSRFDVGPTEIREGAISRVLVLLAVPIVAQNVVQVVQQLVDIFWVGHIGQRAVAAVGLVSPVVSLLLTVSVAGVYVGTQVLVSQRVGAGDESGARTATATALCAAVVAGLAMGGVVYANVDTLLALFAGVRPVGTGSGVFPLASQYLGTLALGIVFAGLSDTLEASYMGWGESRVTLYINVFSVAVNLCLDPILIFGLGPIPGLAMRGAALATVGGYVGGFLLGVWFVTARTTSDVLTTDTLRPKLGDLYELLDIGVPPDARSSSPLGVSLAIGAVPSWESSQWCSPSMAVVGPPVSVCPPVLVTTALERIDTSGVLPVVPDW